MRIFKMVPRITIVRHTPVEIYMLCSSSRSFANTKGLSKLSFDIKIIKNAIG